jgi:hypothetical protein
VAALGVAVATGGVQKAASEFEKKQKKRGKEKPNIL